jgi:hypothetical protein
VDSLFVYREYSGSAHTYSLREAHSSSIRPATVSVRSPVPQPMPQAYFLMEAEPTSASTNTSLYAPSIVGSSTALPILA